MKSCLQCKQQYQSQNEKYCSKKCNALAQITSVNKLCDGCSKNIIVKKSYLKYKTHYCSKQCFLTAIKKKLKPCKVCRKLFIPRNMKKGTYQVICSFTCVQQISKKLWAREYRSCIKCLKTDSPHSGKGVCKRCVKKEYRKSPVYQKFIKEYFKTGNGKWKRFIYIQKKRSKQTTTDITESWIKELFENTKICILCNKEIENNTTYPYGKHLDHIKPINMKGLFMKNNVRFVHGKCNTRRKKKSKKFLKILENFLSLP